MAAVYTFSPRSSSKREGFSLNVYQVLGLMVMISLALLILVGGYLLFREYAKVRQLRQEVVLLKEETKRLSAQYERLTAKEVVFKKARRLGLHPPKKEQIIKVR